MKNFFLLSFIRTQQILNTIKQINIIRIVSFLFVIFCFLAGGYYIFFRIFNYLSSLEIIGVALMERTLEMAFFIFFMMLLFSNVITSFSTFYNNQELNFLFTLPIKPSSIYLSKLFENALYSSWATMVVALPLIFAYGICSNAKVLYYPVSLLSLLCYIIIPASIASIIIFIIITIFPYLKPKDVVLTAIIFIIGLTLLYIKLNNPDLLKVFETENEQRLIEFAANLTTIGGSYLPSTWLSNILKNFKENNPRGLFYFVLLIMTSVSIVILAFIGARLVYLSSFIKVSEHAEKKNGRRSILYEYGGNKEANFLKKDILLFLRNPTQWVQLAIFVILLVIYIFSLRRTPLFFTFPIWRTIVSFANFAYISFVLATLGVRFIFPAISLERSGLWIIISSPFSFKRLIRVKFYFNLILGILIMESLLLLANSFIKIDRVIYLLMPPIAIFVAASLISITLGMGCVYPQFNEDNPSKIAAGTGGIITALLSIAYVGLVIIILAGPAHNYLLSRHFNQQLNPVIILSHLGIFIILNIFSIFLPLRFGLRSLQNRDF
uniref:Uncharacterized protein n=1 Tax=candidate division WOR-3 bacterium TaxID=2052148 RepID=A0A7C4X9I3_UNCW3